MTAHMNTESMRVSQGARSSLPLIGPLLGVVAAGLCIVQLAVPESSALTERFMLHVGAFLPPLILALLVGSPARDHPRRAALLATPPIAFGLVTATVLIQYPLPEATALIVFGALLSALPFFAAGALARPRIQ